MSDDQSAPVRWDAGGGKPKHASLWLAIILMMGFGIRLAGLAWGEAYAYGSQGDSVEAYAVAVDYARGEPRAQYLGQPKFTEHSKLPGPLWALFCLAGLRGWGSIEGAAVAIILLNTGVIYLTCLLAARTVGVPAALWGALLIATSPWAVHYSVVVFNPDVMSFLGVLLFLALWRVTRRDGSKAIFWVSLLLWVMPQFHLFGLMLIPAVAVVLWLARPRLNVLWMTGGALAGLCLYLPYIHGEMAHGWQNTRGVLLGGRSGHSLEAFKVFSAPWSFLVNYWAPRWTFTAAEYREMCRACFGSFGLFVAVNAVSVVLAIFLVLGAFFGVKEAMRGFLHSPRAVFARSPGVLFLTILFTVPLIAGLAGGKPFHARYCLALLAPLFALAGAASVKWLATPRISRLFLVLLVVTTCANVRFMPAMYRFQQRQIEEGPRFIPSFRKLETVYRSLKAHAGKGRSVQVEDEGYLRTLPPQDNLLRGAALIRRYVAIREKENALLPGAQPAPAIYRLCPADQAKPGESAVACRENGVALVAAPAGQ